MEILFKDVLERDVDLMLIDSFCNDDNFVDFIVGRFGIASAVIKKIHHSVEDIKMGETDVCVWFEANNKQYAVMIEDKIDANAQPEQYERYEMRAGNLKRVEKLEECFILIIAPKLYLKTNEMARKYPNQISYEELLSYYEARNPYKTSLLRRAIRKKEDGYIPIEDFAITKFWEKYYEYRRRYYPDLQLLEVDGPRGSRAVWATFKTNNPSGKLEVWHKADRGCVDLQLPKLGGYEEEVKEILNELLEGIIVDNASKSVALRIKVPKLDFRQPFEIYQSVMVEIFDAVRHLTALADQIYYSELCRKVEGLTGRKIL